MIQYDASRHTETSAGSLLKSRVGHACAEVYKSLTSRMMWLYRSLFLPSSSLIYSPYWLCHCLSTSNSGQASPSMRASWRSAVVLNVSLLLLWHFLLTLFAAYKTSVQAWVTCAPWHSSRIWFVPSHIAWQPQTVTPPSLRHHCATIITAAYHRRLGWCVPIQWHQMNPEVGGTFFFEQFVYSRSGPCSLSPFSGSGSVSVSGSSSSSGSFLSSFLFFYLFLSFFSM